MINLKSIGASLVNGNNGNVSFAVENLEKTLEVDPINPIVDRLSLDELVELAEEYLEIDKEIKRAKEHKLRIWGQDKYLSKPLGNSILEREHLSTETLRSINTLQSRKEYIESVIYSNKDNILSNISPEVLKNKISNPRFQAYITAYNKSKPAILNQSNADTTSDDLITFPEFVTMRFKAVYRSLESQVSNMLNSKEAIIDEFKKLFFTGNRPQESRLLIQILVEHKRYNSDLKNCAA